jgi:hypothetical protein
MDRLTTIIRKLILERLDALPSEELARYGEREEMLRVERWARGLETLDVRGDSLAEVAARVSLRYPPGSRSFEEIARNSVELAKAIQKEADSHSAPQVMVCAATDPNKWLADMDDMLARRKAHK